MNKFLRKEAAVNYDDYMKEAKTGFDVYQHTSADALNRLKTGAYARAEEQRRLQHLQDRFGTKDNITKLRRLGLAKLTSILAPTLIGGVGGGLLGAIIDANIARKNNKRNDGGFTAGLGLLGLAAGGATGIGGNVIGSIAGNFGGIPSREELAKRLEDSDSLSNYLVPGRAAKLTALLDKDFVENENVNSRIRQLAI